MSDWKSRAKPVSSGSWKERATLVKDYNSPEAQAAEAELTKMAAHKAEQTPISIATRSVARGLSGGFLDEGVGALGAIVDQIKGTDKTFGESYEANRDEQRLKQKADDINNPVASFVGRVGGGVATGGLLPGAATLTGSVGYGALQGAGESDRQGLDLVKDASIGGAFGAAGYGVGKAIEAAPKVLNRQNIADKLDDFAKAKAVKSIEPILSQQEKLDQRGIADKLGSVLLDNKITKFGSSVDDMLPRLESLLAEKGQAIGAARHAADDMGGRVDISELQRYAQDLIEKSKGMGSDAESYAQAVAKEIEGLSVNPIRSMDDTAKLLGELGKSGKYNKLSAPIKNEAIRDVRGKIVDLMDEDIANLSPDLFKQHTQDREIFSLLKAGEEILDKATARGSKNASLGLRDTIFSAAGIAKGGNVSESTIQGIALAMASKLMRERGNASAAVLAKKLADFARPGKKLPGSSFAGGTTLDDLGDFAAQRAVKFGADQAYSAATGDEDGMPDPLKDQIVKSMAEKYNLSETEQKALRRMLPGVYDMAGMVKGGVKSNIRQNTINPGQLKDYKYASSGKKLSERKLLNGTTHEIYNDGGDIEHYLLKDGKRVAKIQGNNRQGPDGKPIFVVHVSSAEGGHGYGKQLYDAVLDTHGAAASDISLSPGGSHKVWTQHIGGHPEVDFKPGTWGTDDRHVAKLKDRAAFRSKVSEQDTGLDDYWVERMSGKMEADDVQAQKTLDKNIAQYVDDPYLTSQASRRVPSSVLETVEPKLTYDNRGNALNKILDKLSLSPAERKELVNDLLSENFMAQDRANDKILNLLARLR